MECHGHGHGAGRSEVGERVDYRLDSQSQWWGAGALRRCVLARAELRRRRLSDEPPPARGPRRSVESSIEQVPNEHYDPSVGYAPYWAGGDWVFEKEKVRKRPTKSPARMCGNACPSIFINYGKVCGRTWRGYSKTYQSYCDLRNDDCTLKRGLMIAYRGPCTGLLRTWETRASPVRTRALRLLSDFRFRNPTTSSTLFPMLL